MTEVRSLVVVDSSLHDPVHLQLSDQLQALIESGELGPDARLPSVRELARDLDIAPNTVVRAYATLQEAGFIVSEGWRGTRVAKGKRSRAGAREATLRSLVRRVVESLRHRGYSPEQIADVFAWCAEELRRR